MAKQALTQRSFILGQPREEFLEAADIDLTDNSLRVAENVRIKATRTIAQRPGTERVAQYAPSATLTTPKTAHEIRPADGLVYGLEITFTSAVVVDADGATVWSASLPGGTMSSLEVASLWVAPFGYETIIGTGSRMLMLTYNGTTFSIAAFTFDVGPGASLAQPYWSYVSGVTLTPSALTGAITVTASAALFTASWVGMRIRYGRKEILITGYTSATQVSGTVISQLPPSYRLTLSTTAGLVVGDAVIGADTDFNGLVIAIGGSDVDVVTISFFDGPDVSEKLSFPSGTATVSAKTSISPLASPIWDEPIMSPIRGYPRSGTSAGGRLFLCDFPQAPDAIVASSVRAVTDMLVGDEDDDAIARAIGDNRPRLLHVVNAGDVLIFTNLGSYLVSLRDGTALTPSNFNPIKFDARGCSEARPAPVDDGVVFIEASGKAIAAATLSGNIYLKWSVRTLSTYHTQLFTGPIQLCGPPSDCTFEDKYLFVVNADGTVVAMSWVDGFDVEKVGFVPWTTSGTFTYVAPIFGGYWFFATRTINAGAYKFIERLSVDAIMDCEMDATTTLPTGFNGTTMDVAGQGWDGGQVVIASNAVPGDFPDDARVGFNFTSRVMPWPKKLIQHPYAGLRPCRCIRAAASVLNTGVFQIRCNATTQSFGGYEFGDALDEPPADKTRIYRASVIGRRHHPEIEFIKPRPSRFQILAITQEVSY